MAIVIVVKIIECLSVPGEDHCNHHHHHQTIQSLAMKIIIIITPMTNKSGHLSISSAGKPGKPVLGVMLLLKFSF